MAASLVCPLRRWRVLLQRRRPPRDDSPSCHQPKHGLRDHRGRRHHRKREQHRHRGQRRIHTLCQRNMLRGIQAVARHSKAFSSSACSSCPRQVFYKMTAIEEYVTLILLFFVLGGSGSRCEPRSVWSPCWREVDRFQWTWGKG